MSLDDALEGREYTVTEVNTEDEELNSFLFSLGCYSGETVAVVTNKKSGLVVSIKDGRYNFDHKLAQAISIR